MDRNFKAQSNQSNQSNRSQSSSQQQQPMMSGFMETAKERPIATAAALGGAVAAGAFLWSRRDQISQQFSNMSGQSSERSGFSGKQQSESMQSAGRSSSSMGSESIGQPEMAGAGTSAATSATRATGGRSGSAQTGQNLNPARTSSDPVSY